MLHLLAHSLAILRTHPFSLLISLSYHRSMLLLVLRTHSVLVQGITSHRAQFRLIIPFLFGLLISEKIN